MIPAQELMIGNWVMGCNNEPFQIDEYTYTSIHEKTWGGRTSNCPSAIPITPEWLKRLGFEEYKGALRLEVTHGLYFGYFEQYTVNTIVFRNPAGHGSSIVLHHIHQLQNLYFALTGQQLNVIK